MNDEIADLIFGFNFFIKIDTQLLDKIIFNTTV